METITSNGLTKMIKSLKLLLISSLLVSASAFAETKKVNDTLSDVKVKADEVKFYAHDLVIDSLSDEQKQKLTKSLETALKNVDAARVLIMEHWNTLDRNTQRQVLKDKEKAAK